MNYFKDTKNFEKCPKYLGGLYYPINTIKDKSDLLKNEINFGYIIRDSQKRKNFVETYNKKNSTEISYPDIWLDIDKNNNSITIKPCFEKKEYKHGIEDLKHLEYVTYCDPMERDNVNSFLKNSNNSNGGNSKKSKSKKNKKSKKSKSIKRKRY